MATYNHQNNFATNLTSNQTSGVTTTPLNSIPSVAAPFWIALDATNTNSSYEVVLVTSKTATHINHAATTFAHTTAEEVRMVIPAAEMDALWDGLAGWTPTTVALTYSSADDPVFVVTTASDLTGSISVGMKMKFTNNSTTFYGIVEAIASGSITLYGGTDYDVANSAITNVYYSSHKSPYGFPTDPAKWTVSTTNTSDLTQNPPSTGTWYNLGPVTIDVPIGAWRIRYDVVAQHENATATSAESYVTLSTANNSESDANMTCYMLSVGASGDNRSWSSQSREKTVVVASKTTHYLNIKTTTVGGATKVIGFKGNLAPTLIRAINAYL